MVISKIQGGIGNQLFQWAYGRYLSEKYKTPLVLDVSFFSQQNKRTFELNGFPFIKYSEATRYIFRDYILIKDDYCFKNDPINSNFNYFLDGYFQCEKYFKDIEGVIREELKPKDDFVSIVDSSKISVSLHVRRGDYVSVQDYHPLQDIEYYKKALSLIGEYDIVYVFSDDIEWCRNNLTFKNVVFVDNSKEHESLWNMSKCTHNIIANSSFSWWGAWLNANKDKKVIAPLNWFGIKVSVSAKDIYCDGWIKC
jgi:hypothetical protein